MAVGGQRPGGGFADARGGSGDDRDTASVLSGAHDGVDVVPGLPLKRRSAAGKGPWERGTDRPSDVVVADV
jgi:hypothetical protein